MPNGARSSPAAPTLGVCHTAAMARVTLIGKPDCHLCEEARAVVAQVTAELGEAFDERDIGTDPGLHERYWEHIPVVLIDGAQHAFWRVEPNRLRAALLG